MPKRSSTEINKERAAKRAKERQRKKEEEQRRIKAVKQIEQTTKENTNRLVRRSNAKQKEHQNR